MCELLGASCFGRDLPVILKNVLLSMLIYLQLVYKQAASASRIPHPCTWTPTLIRHRKSLDFVLLSKKDHVSVDVFFRFCVKNRTKSSQQTVILQLITL